MSDQGASHFRKIWEYQAGPASQRTTRRVSIAAPRGMPRNTATLVATEEYDMASVVVSPPMIWMKKTASGAYSTICRIEFTATRMAQYSSSPPAKPDQMRTYKRVSTGFSTEI